MFRLILASKFVGRPAVFLPLLALLALQNSTSVQAVSVATPPNALPDPHSYIVTGNYAVASDDVPAQTQQGTVTRTLHINTCNPQGLGLYRMQTLGRLGIAKEAAGDKAGACGAYQTVLSRWGRSTSSVTVKEIAKHAKALSCDTRRGS